jgi:hypothetical protein
MVAACRGSIVLRIVNVHLIHTTQTQEKWLLGKSNALPSVPSVKDCSEPVVNPKGQVTILMDCKLQKD